MTSRPNLISFLLAALCLSAFSRDLSKPAPALQAERWWNSPPIARFEAGKVYVLDFWATWCGPCVHGIPEMNAFKRKYDSKGVVVIGVAAMEHGEEPATRLRLIEEFLASPKSPKIEYALAFDSTDTLKTTWMEATGQSSIPRIFVVDGRGRLVWLGTADRVASVVDAVLAGKWDLEAMEKRRFELEKKLAVELSQDQWDAATRTITEYSENDPWNHVAFAMEHAALSNLRSGNPNYALKFQRYALRDGKDIDPALIREFKRIEKALVEKIGYDPDDWESYRQYLERKKQP